MNSLKTNKFVVIAVAHQLPAKPALLTSQPVYVYCKLFIGVYFNGILQ